jgi:hypothetical protein
LGGGGGVQSAARRKALVREVHAQLSLLLMEALRHVGQGGYMCRMQVCVCACVCVWVGGWVCACVCVCVGVWVCGCVGVGVRVRVRTLCVWVHFGCASFLLPSAACSDVRHVTACHEFHITHITHGTSHNVGTQEGDLKYMVAFPSAVAALEWCLTGVTTDGGMAQHFDCRTCASRGCRRYAHAHACANTHRECRPLRAHDIYTLPHHAVARARARTHAVTDAAMYLDWPQSWNKLLQVDACFQGARGGGGGCHPACACLQPPGAV